MESAIILILVLGLVAWLIGFLPIDDSFKALARGVLLIVAVVYLLAVLFGFSVPTRLRL